MFNLMTKRKDKLKSIINTISGAHTLTHGKIIKSQSNESNVATIKRKENSNLDLITRVCQVGTMVPM